MIRALLIAVAFGAGLPDVAPAVEPGWRLLPEAQVDGTGIFLDQIASGPASASVVHLFLAPAPAFGRAASVSRAQAQEWLSKAAPELTATNWSGAAQVRVTRRAKVLGEPELRELLAATLQREHVKDKGELELRLSRTWTPVSVPDELLSLRVLDLPASGVTANFIVRFELLAGTERLGPWQAVAQARILRDVLVARSPLKRGQPLSGADVIVERRDALALREPAGVGALDDASLEICETVPAGQVVPGRAVRSRPVVQRGRIVDGLLQDGALRISMKVEVLNDGLPGQTVRVRNPKTKREFHAQVQNNQTVLLTF